MDKNVLLFNVFLTAISYLQDSYCPKLSTLQYELTVKSYVLLRKIALPYPHKCLLGFVEAKRGDQQEYLKIILVREVNPVVSDRCTCAQHIVGWTCREILIQFLVVEEATREVF